MFSVCLWAIISNVQPSQQCPEDRRLAQRMPRSVAVLLCRRASFSFWAFYLLSVSFLPGLCLGLSWSWFVPI